MLETGEHDFIFAAEVVLKGADADAGVVGDHADARCREPLVRDRTDARLDDLSLPLIAVQTLHRRSFPRSAGFCSPRQRIAALVHTSVRQLIRWPLQKRAFGTAASHTLVLTRDDSPL